MNYIYDIIVNFNTYAFDFYDWNKEDKLTHIRKIPVCKVKVGVLNQINEYEVIFDTSFLELIKDKTEIFTNKNTKTICYSCLLCDGMNVLAIKIEKNHILKSKLQLEEEEEVLDVCERLSEQDIAFEIKKKNSLDNFVTRKQLNLAKQVNKLLNKTYSLKDFDTLKYIYYECFDKKEENTKEIMKVFIKQIQNNNDSILIKIRDFYKLLEVKK